MMGCSWAKKEKPLSSPVLHCGFPEKDVAPSKNQALIPFMAAQSTACSGHTINLEDEKLGVFYRTQGSSTQEASQQNRMCIYSVTYATWISCMSTVVRSVLVQLPNWSKLPCTDAILPLIRNAHTSYDIATVMNAVVPT